MAGIRSIARPLLASVFIMDGIDAIRHAEEHAEQAKILEKPLAKVNEMAPWIPADLKTMSRITGAISVAAGTMLALGKAPRVSAAVLAAISIPVTAVKYPVVQGPKDQRSENLTGLIRQAALIGGLIIAIEDRQGKPSLKWRASNWQAHRENLAQERAKHRKQRAELKKRQEPLIQIGQ